MSNASPKDPGTIGISSRLSVSNAPSILFQWTSLIPLVIYLASSSYAHKLVGRAALGGRVITALFPELGVIGSIVNLLDQQFDYLDRACSISEYRREVWDVNWGSTFPCANGSVFEILTKKILGSTGQAIKTTADHLGRKGSSMPFGFGSKPSPSQKEPEFRRHQFLHVIQLRRDPKRAKCGLPASPPVVLDIIHAVCLLAGGAVTILYGLYGTMSAIIISLSFLLARLCIKIQVPFEYLGDTEGGRIPGCMLVSTHENSSTWYLFMGERGIIDGLLNKNMIYCVESRFGNFGAGYLKRLLRLLGFAQLLAMTYVAAQQGWDGIALLIFVFVAWASEKLFYGDDMLAERWMNRHRIAYEARTFDFPGRTPMLGAIQIFKETPVYIWMDRILVPSERRDLWIKKLNGQFNEKTDAALEQKLDPVDQRWLKTNYAWSHEAANIMKREFTIS
jgi:hypothetical protein